MSVRSFILAVYAAAHTHLNIASTFIADAAGGAIGFGDLGHGAAIVGINRQRVRFSVYQQHVASEAAVHDHEAILLDAAGGRAERRQGQAVIDTKARADHAVTGEAYRARVAIDVVASCELHLVDFHPLGVLQGCGVAQLLGLALDYFHRCCHVGFLEYSGKDALGVWVAVGNDYASGLIQV